MMDSAGRSSMPECDFQERQIAGGSAVAGLHGTTRSCSERAVDSRVNRPEADFLGMGEATYGPGTALLGVPLSRAVTIAIRSQAASHDGHKSAQMAGGIGTGVSSED